ncbi:GapS6b family protein [Microbulbifer spongiae]|uniref:PIN domain-containing protein n=1 Tax=Microbulbifer spongiae TaxID=2944933 RepID=A0ABY9EH02_9GAMM|nr:hypothetical protein [Microbulbifer sp. MI-G]WKD51034.1 hypothetical protein M8T91_06330 [Microbulbifer sp. MI-G]
MDESDGTTIETVHQQHYGTGDNVKEKHVHHAVSPEAIHGPVQDILTCLRHRDVGAAQDKLRTLQIASQLDSRTAGILDVLAILVDIGNSDIPRNGYSQVESCLRHQLELTFSDIALSALMRLDILNERTADAGSRYQAMDDPGECCQEVFFEFIADQLVLEEFLSNRVHQLTEATLCGLTRGLLRCERFELAEDSSIRLCSTYPCFNSEVVKLITSSNCLNSQLIPSHYWLITNSERREIFALVDRTVSLLEECQGKDARLVNQSIAFLHYLGGASKQLVDACRKYIANIEVVDKDAALFLRSLREKNPEGIEGLPYEIERAQNDFSYRKSLIDKLRNSSEISTEELVLFGSIAENSTIKSWMENGGKVATEGDFERDFISIELHCYASDGDARSEANIKRAVSSFLTNHKSHLHKINPPRLLELTSMLLARDMGAQVCSLLRPIIPTTDIWLSPIVRNYIHSLLGSDQLTTLNNILSEIHQDDWCDFIWQVKARQCDHLNDMSGAIDAMESALSLSPMSLSAWHYSVSLYKRQELPEEDYAKFLERVPDEVFESQSKQAWQLLYEISAHGGFARAENIIVTWFLQNPDRCAKLVTDFHLTEVTDIDAKATKTPSKTTEHCLGGFSYLIDGQPAIKLVVEGVSANHSCTLNSSSPLGQSLLKMNIGDTANHGIQEIKLLEVMPPYVAIFRLAIELRQANNDGSDCFYSFSLPENPDEMVASLEQKMLAMEGGNKELICSNPQYPLFLKGHMLGDSCPVHSALNHLTSKASVKSPLPSVGEGRPEYIIVDVYAIVYMGLTGLIHGLIQSDVVMLITVETKAYLESFLQNISRDDYMRVGVTNKGKLWRVTSEDIQVGTSDVQLAIRHILKVADVAAPNLVDMPPDIVQIQSAVDSSVYSSLKLSISNDVPWLCIDEAFAQLSLKSDYPVVNTLQFFTLTGHKLDIAKKLPGLYHHVSSGLPYPLTYEEILLMANSDDEHAHYFLAEILRMYPHAYSDTNAAVSHLSKIVVLVMAKAYIDGEILNGLRVRNPRNNGYAEKVFNVCCYISMQFKDGNEAEYKLALLLCAVIDEVKDMPTMKKLIQVLGSGFIAGHFLSFVAVNAHIEEIRSR